MENFADRLSKLRREHGWTQEQLAQRLHVSRQTISSWEKGRTQPDLEGLAEIADVLEISLDDLILGLKMKDPKVPYALFFWLLIGTLSGSVFLYILLHQKGAGAASYFANSSYLLFYVIIWLPLHLMMKYHDYSLLAGYDDDEEYDERQICRMLTEIIFETGISSVVFLLMSAAVLMFSISLPFPLLLVYSITITGILIITSFRYQKRVVKNYRDPGNGIRIVEGCFLAFEGILVAVLCFVMDHFGIRNNTGEAFILMIFVIVHTVLNSGWLVHALSRHEQLKKTQDHYVLGALDGCIMVANLLLFVMLIMVAAMIA